ncbi:MAG: hypothetical protein ACKVT2_09045 [Saprospiraceae bacterium]
MKFKLSFYFLLLSLPFLPAQNTVIWSDSMELDVTTRPITTPRVNLLPDGTPLFTWGVNGDFINATSQIWCSRLENGSFTTPIAVVNEPHVPLLYGFAGYDVAVSDSLIFIVFEQSQKGIFLTRSVDGGFSFSSPAVVQGPIPGGYAIFPSVTIDGTHNPVVSYIQYKDGVSTYQLRRSTDGGFNFESSVMGNASTPGAAVCECCASDLLASGDSIWLIFRYNNQNLRDIWVSRSTNLSSSYDISTDVDQTDWNLNVCPIAGPRMARSGDSLITVWMSGASGTGRVYLSTLNAETMQLGQQLSFSSDSNPQTAQSQSDVAAFGDTIGVVFVEKATDIVFYASTMGANGLEGQGTRFAIQDHTLQLPSLAFSKGVFHLVYADATSGQVIYRQGILTGNSPLKEPVSETRIHAIPNPAISNTTMVVEVALNHKGIAHFEILDPAGKSIRKFAFLVKNIDDQAFSINLNGIPGGVYFLTGNLDGVFLGTEKIILK